jgi:hypothetical protein
MAHIAPANKQSLMDVLCYYTAQKVIGFVLPYRSPEDTGFCPILVFMVGHKLLLDQLQRGVQIVGVQLLLLPFFS